MRVLAPRDKAKKIAPQDGDTLASIAEREAAAGNDISAEEISMFNWGTSEPERVQEFMRDELGARARGADNLYERRSDDEGRSDLYVPQPFQQDGFATGQTHTIRVKFRKCPDQFRSCLSLPSVTFGFDSAFVRPSVADHVADLKPVVDGNPDARIMIFGHTDAVGDDPYNKRLSERRAWAVYALVICDPEPWETLYNHPDETWGLAVIQEILADLGHDPGPVDGDMGPSTQAAMRDFLGLGEGASVQNDADFRRPLFEAYMRSKHDLDLGPDRFMGDGFMGCGEFNLMEPTNSAEEKNRRVTFYLFNKDRLPNLPCAFDDIAPCKRQMLDTSRHIEGFSCSFYDSLAQRCPAEAQSHTVGILIDRHLLDNEFEAHVYTKLWLTGSGGYNRALQTTAATAFDQSYYILRFEFTPPGESYTLRKQMTDGDWLTIFEDVPYDVLDDHGDSAPVQPVEEATPELELVTFEDYLDEHHPLPDPAHEPVDPWEVTDDDLDL